jgi:hypothetical protein
MGMGNRNEGIRDRDLSQPRARQQRQPHGRIALIFGERRDAESTWEVDTYKRL